MAGWLYPVVALALAIAIVGIAFAGKLRRKARAKGRKAQFRALAYDRFLQHHSLSDQPKHEFRGNEAVIVFKREDFVVRNGKEEPTFIYLSRNIFGEYFFCVIDRGLSMVHLPRDRALSFLKDFPDEYAAEVKHLSARTGLSLA